MKESASQAFVSGAGKGLRIAVNSVLPNILLAYALVYALQLSGLLERIASLFAPVMRLAGLPGPAAAIFFSALLSGTGAAGAACGLYMIGELTARDCCILFPAVVLMTGQIQYLGRVLDVIGVGAGRRLPLLLLNILLGFVCMLIMNGLFQWGVIPCPA